MRLDEAPEHVESGLKRRIIVDLLQVRHEFPNSLMVLQRAIDQPFPLRIGLLGKGRVEHGFFQQRVEFQLGKDMLGNDLLQVLIGRVLILLKEGAYLTVIGFEHGNGIVRPVHRIVPVGMVRLCHDVFSLYIWMFMKRSTALLSEAYRMCRVAGMLWMLMREDACGVLWGCRGKCDTRHPLDVRLSMRCVG